MKSVSFLLFFSFVILLFNLHQCKKGVRINDNQSNCADLDQLNVEWWWAGTLTSRCTSEPDFVPSLQNLTDINLLSTLPPKTEWLMTFDDVNGEFPLDPKVVASQWPKIASAASKVVSPSVSINGKAMNYSQWLSTFFEACGAQCQVAAIAVESDTDDINELMYVLEHLNAKYQKPIWLIDIRFPNISSRTALNLMKTLLPKLDKSPAVQRYAWDNIRSSASSVSSLYKSDFKSRVLTSLGKFFASFKDGKGASEDGNTYHAGNSIAQSLGKGLDRQFFSGLFNKVIKEDLGDVNFSWSNGTLPLPKYPFITGKDFSMIASGSVVVNVSGLYQFQTHSSDGIRLWINHVLMIDDWTKQLSLSSSGSLILRAGVPVPIRIDYFHGNESSGGVCKLKWRAPGMRVFGEVPMSVMSPDVPQEQPEEALVLKGPGLMREFYKDSKLKKSAAEDVGNVDLNWYTSNLNGSFVISDVKISGNRFGMSARGQIVMPYTGTYRFQVATSGGSRLWIDGNLVIDDWSTTMPALDSSRIFSFLMGDVVSIRLDFHQDKKASETSTDQPSEGFIHLKWSVPSDKTFHVIPQEAMFPYREILLSNNLASQDDQQSRSLVIGLAVVSALLVCGVLFAALAAVYHFHVKKTSSYTRVDG